MYLASCSKLDEYDRQVLMFVLTFFYGLTESQIFMILHIYALLLPLLIYIIYV